MPRPMQHPRQAPRGTACSVACGTLLPHSMSRKHVPVTARAKVHLRPGQDAQRGREWASRRARHGRVSAADVGGPHAAAARISLVQRQARLPEPPWPYERYPPRIWTGERHLRPRGADPAAPALGTSTGIARISPVRGLVASRSRLAGAPSALCRSAVQMNRVRWSGPPNIGASCAQFSRVRRAAGPCRPRRRGRPRTRPCPPRPRLCRPRRCRPAPEPRRTPRAPTARRRASMPNAVNRPRTTRR